ncbi:hypothetical protein BX600DRAFT_474533 [Xylariales sp. PMI_506]|nr:hypothetical protein BX600DRAFT_474533 [Xylariales sp. PMI_506]
MATLPVTPYVIETFTKGLRTFQHIIAKAEAYAAEKGIDADATFVQARLIEDQLPFAFQVQTATKAVQTNLGRLSGNPDPEIWPYNEATLADLKARLQKALDLLATFDVASTAAKEQEEISFPFNGGSHKREATKVVLFQGLPNFFFHVATGYSILRAKGVPVGKGDWLTSFVDIPL